MSGGLAIGFAALGVVAAGLALVQASVLRALALAAGALIALGFAFLALGAGFAGVLQMVVYVGAVAVLFVFAVGTLDLEPRHLAAERASLSRWRGPAAGCAGLVGAGLILSLAPLAEDTGAGGPVEPRAVGALLFGPWAVAVELASVLLLAGLIGVRLVGREARRGGHGR